MDSIPTQHDPCLCLWISRKGRGGFPEHTPPPGGPSKRQSLCFRKGKEGLIQRCVSRSGVGRGVA